MLKQITALGLGIALLTGCASKPAPAPAPEVDPMASDIPSDATERVRTLRTASDQLASFADQLPGATEAEYRQRMSRGLDELAQGIRLARGSRTSGAFRVQVYTIFETARLLRERPIDQGVETLVSGALRSAHGALRDLARSEFAASAELNEQIEQFAESLRPLETDRGAAHRVSAARSFRRAVRALQTVGELYAARVPTTQATEVRAPGEAADEAAEEPAAGEPAMEPATETGEPTRSPAADSTETVPAETVPAEAEPAVDEPANAPAPESATPATPDQREELNK